MVAFPKELTNKKWQQHKPLFAKAKATGIGEALTALEQSFAKSGFTVGPGSLATETLDPIEFAAKLNTFFRSLDTVHVKDIEAQAAAVQTKIAAARTAFAKDKGVRTVLTKLETDLTTFRAAIKPNGSITKKFKADVQEIHNRHVKQESIALRTLFKGSSLSSQMKAERLAVLREARELVQNPVLTEIHRLWGGQSHVCRNIRTVPDFWDQSFAKDFPAVAKRIHAGSAKQAYNALPWIDDVGDEVGKTATKKVRTMITGTVTEAQAVTTMAQEYIQSLTAYSAFCDDLETAENLLRKYA